MNLEEQVAFLAQELFSEIDRVNQLVHLVGEIYKTQCEVEGKDYERTYTKSQLINKANEITHLHNRVNDIEKVLGMDGSVPRIRSKHKDRL